MMRLTKYDRYFIALLIPIWVACFSLSIYHIFDFRGIPSIYVNTQGASAYPLVVALTPEASNSGIEHGDRLISINGRDLRGVSRLEYMVRFVEAADWNSTVRVVFEHNGNRKKISLTVDTIEVTLYLLPASFMFALVAIILFWRAKFTPQARAFILSFMITAIYLSANLFYNRLETYASLLLHGISLVVLIPLLIRAFLLFPNKKPQTDWLWRFGPWTLSIIGPLHMSRFGLGLPRHIGVPAVVIVTAVFFLVLLLIVTQNYRTAGRVGRRQMRWVIFGTYLSVLPVIVTGILVSINFKWMELYLLSFSALAIAPLSILISIMRVNLFDIDRMISATATYNILLVFAVALGVVLVPLTTELFVSTLGLNPLIGQILMAILLGILVVIAQPGLRRLLERMFFMERYALDRGFEELLRALALCKNPSDLLQKLGHSLTLLLRPEPCVIYSGNNHSFTPVYADGKAVPSVLPADSTLAHELERSFTPLALGTSARWHEHSIFNDYDRATLSALNAALLAPLNQRSRLVGMICLGPKRSGDVYTPTDTRLIGAVADRVSAQLDQFDRTEFMREAKAMQDSLRRYVPGAIAEQITRGSNLESVEQEVTVLFVDIRGYATYAESLRPVEIFSTINQYTEAISGLIRKQGGNIVEFNGDGMMTVFGAPDHLENKESKAVLAAREIIHAVPKLPARNDWNEPLSVGVGIATGAAFVGSIRATDRWIWSAIGNTTNLAARLQSLTRDLNVAIVIDKATWEASNSDSHVADFKLHRDVPIRGRRQVEDIYTLPVEKTI